MLATTQNGATGVNPGSAYNPGFEKVALDQNAVQALETAYMRGMITSEDIRKREGRIARENAENAAATATAKEVKDLAPLSAQAKQLELQSRIKLNPIVTENTAKGIEAELQLRPGALNNALQQQKLDAGLAQFAAELKKASAQAGTAKAVEEIKDPYGLTRQYVSIFGQTPPTKADGSFDLNAAQQRLGSHLASINLTPVQQVGLKAAASAHRLHEMYRDGKILDDAEVTQLTSKWQSEASDLDLRDKTRAVVKANLIGGLEKLGGWSEAVTPDGDLKSPDEVGRVLDKRLAELTVQQARYKALAALSPDKQNELSNMVSQAKLYQQQIKEAQEIIGMGDSAAVGPAQGSWFGKSLAYLLTYMPAATGGTDKMYNEQTKLTMLTAKSVLEMASKMKGNLSDRDIKFLQQATPSLKATEDVWRDWLDELSGVAMRAVENADAALRGATGQPTTEAAPPAAGATAPTPGKVLDPRLGREVDQFAPGDPRLQQLPSGTWYRIEGSDQLFLRR